MINIGTVIPDGTYQAYHEDNIRPVKLDEYRGQWLILLFYPGDFTFVCPTELAEMARLYPEFKKLEAEVCGVSTDSAYVHKAWHDTSPALRSVSFPLLADTTGSLSRGFGVYLEEEGVALRGTFLIDPEGILRAYEVHDNSIGRNAGEMLRKLQAAIRVRNGEGEVCPANWQPGESTMTPSLDLVGKI
ncbi:MAG: ahpC [Nitrospira sp.]|jgi:peroxiredoxin (alkyl hydroperoxide reductase subunit C)|nr:ahpC [Nitrospira sp.]